MARHQGGQSVPSVPQSQLPPHGLRRGGGRCLLKNLKCGFRSCLRRISLHKNLIALCCVTDPDSTLFGKFGPDPTSSYLDPDSSRELG